MGCESFLERLGTSERAELLRLLNPGLAAELASHLLAECAGGAPDGTSAPADRTCQPIVARDAGTAANGASPPLTSDDGAGQQQHHQQAAPGPTGAPGPPGASAPSGPSGPSGQASAVAPPLAPLLTAGQLRQLLPALLPEARRWLEAQQREGRRQGRQQRDLQELARYSKHIEQAGTTRVHERAQLQRLVARQQAALLQGAKHAQALRAAGAAHQRAAERAAEQNRRLERGLRAAVRPSGLCARDDGRR